MATKDGYILEANGNTISIIDSGSLRKEETALNSNKLGGKAPEYYIQPKNLLDNSDFRNPVNQRGQTSYTGAGYTIDRWRSWDENSVITVNNGYISYTNDLYQYIVGLDKDTTYTFAVKNTNGDILTITAKPSENKNIYYGLNIFYDENIGVGVRCWHHALTENLVWACLYEGSYTIDTLPPYVPKGYGAELAECMRYYQKHDHVGLTCRNNGFASVPLPIEMRINPTITIGTRYLYAADSTDKSDTYSNTLGVDKNCIIFANSFYNGFITISCRNVELNADL